MRFPQVPKTREARNCAPNAGGGLVPEDPARRLAVVGLFLREVELLLQDFLAPFLRLLRGLELVVERGGAVLLLFEEGPQVLELALELLVREDLARRLVVRVLRALCGAVVCAPCIFFMNLSKR